MLRISESTISTDALMLRLEGQVSQHNVEIARAACEQALGKKGQLILDMADVTYADRLGVAWLRELQQQQVKLVNCSPFLKEQLKDPITY